MRDFLSGVHFGLEEASILATTVFLCFLVLQSRRSLLNRRAFKDTRQPHSTHGTATPRLGGAVIFASVIFTTVFFDGFFGGRYAKFAVSMLPMVFATLWEDMLRPTTPQVRLSATAASCLFTMATLQIWFTDADVPLIDPWMTGGFGVMVTLLFAATSVNAFNMVDGLNGLCGAIAVAALMSLHLIGNAVGHEFLAHMAIILAVAVAGFLLFNFPKGKIFLGDTGSYVLGYLIAWFGVSLCYWFHMVSPWAILLIVAYPVSDLVITLVRRVLAGHSPFRPDNLHFHHLVMLLLRQKSSHGKRLDWHNPAATLLLLPLAVAPMIPAVLFFDRPGVLQAAVLAYAVAIAGIYAGLLAVTKPAAQKVSG